MKIQIVSVLAALCSAFLATAQSPYLVKKINNIPASFGALPDNLTDVNGTLFFTADDGVTGKELWKTDGTAAGTVLVKDIKAGAGGSGAMGLTNMNGTLFFNADDGVNGYELWKSDGTTTGTVMVKDIYPGSNSGYPILLKNVNGILYFRASDNAAGIELWKSDGTTAGTVMVTDLRPGINSSSPSDFAEMNGLLFFAATSTNNNFELWKTDGTAAGTVLVKDIEPGSFGSSPFYLTNVNGTLFFQAYAAGNFGLWKSDGTTAGTVLLNIPDPGNFSIFFQNLINVNGTLFYTVKTTANGWELWKSDGTAAGTFMVKDIYTGAGDAFPDYLTIINSSLYFSANSPGYGTELWKSDGTETGTVMVKDIAPGFFGGVSKLVNFNGTLYFNGSDQGNGGELWKSDGTEAGTVLIKDIYTGTNSSSPGRLTVSNNKLFFGCEYSDANTATYYGYELWSLGSCNTGSAQVNATGKTYFFNNEVQTAPPTKTCYCDLYNNLVSAVDAVGASPVSGAVDAKMWIEVTQSAAFVKRHYEITPAANAGTATAKITLYFTQQEFTDYNAVNSLQLPVDAADAANNKANLVIEKMGGTSSDGTGLPGSYSGGVTTIDPDDADIIWNNTLNRWEVSFNVTGFSGLFVKAGNAVLPVYQFVFAGSRLNNKNSLQWQTTDELNTEEFIVQRSNNGKDFYNIVAIAAKGTGSNSYSYADNYDEEKTWYRIKISDNGGRVTYSNIIALGGKQTGYATAYPNPFINSITLQTGSNKLLNTEAAVTDASGRIIKVFTIKHSVQTIPVNDLPAGVYLIKLADGEVLKIMK